MSLLEGAWKTPKGTTPLPCQGHLELRPKPIKTSFNPPAVGNPKFSLSERLAFPATGSKVFCMKAPQSRTAVAFLLSNTKDSSLRYVDTNPKCRPTGPQSSQTCPMWQWEGETCVGLPACRGHSLLCSCSVLCSFQTEPHSRPPLEQLGSSLHTHTHTHTTHTPHTHTHTHTHHTHTHNLDQVHTHTHTHTSPPLIMGEGRGLATQEEEIGRITVRSQPRQTVL
jgi:hypothetical protein